MSVPEEIYRTAPQLLDSSLCRLLLHRFEILFAYATQRAYPFIGNLFEWGVGCNT